MNTPQIYVACLAAYNAGMLHGKWIDCDQEPDDIMEEIQEMLGESPAPDAEEWAIHDTDNFDGWTPGSIEQASAAGRLIEKHGSAVVSWLESGVVPDAVEDWETGFSEAYSGEYDSEEAFIDEYLTDSGIMAQLENIQVFGQTADQYLDLEAIAHDQFIDSFVSYPAGLGKVYVFSRD